MALLPLLSTFAKLASVDVAPYKSPYPRLPVAYASNNNISTHAPSQFSAQAGFSSSQRPTAPSVLTQASAAYHSSTTIAQQLSSLPKNTPQSSEYSASTGGPNVAPFDNNVNITIDKSTRRVPQNVAPRQYQSPYGNTAPVAPRKTTKPKVQKSQAQKPKAQKTGTTLLQQAINNSHSAGLASGQFQPRHPTNYNGISQPSPIQNGNGFHTSSNNTPATINPVVAQGAPTYYTRSPVQHGNGSRITSNNTPATINPVVAQGAPTYYRTHQPSPVQYGIGSHIPSNANPTAINSVVSQGASAYYTPYQPLPVQQGNSAHIPSITTPTVINNIVAQAAPTYCTPYQPSPVQHGNGAHFTSNTAPTTMNNVVAQGVPTYSRTHQPSPFQYGSGSNIPSNMTPATVDNVVTQEASAYYRTHQLSASQDSRKQSMGSSMNQSLPHNMNHGSYTTASMDSNLRYDSNYQVPRPTIGYPEFTSVYGDPEEASPVGPYYLDKKSKYAQLELLNMGLVCSVPFPLYRNPIDPTVPLPPAPPTEFHFFSKLPLEVKNRIWELACSRRRVIDVRQKPVDANERDFRNAGQFYSTTPKPALLQVCKESRKVALKLYEPFEMTSVDHHSLALEYLEHQVPKGLVSGFEPQVPAYVHFRAFINWNADVLYLNPEHMSTAGYKFYHADGRYYPETSVIRFIEPLLENPETCKKLRNIAFHKHIMRDNNTKLTNIGVSSIAFQAISVYLVRLRTKLRVYIVTDEECCDGHPEHHDDQPITESGVELVGKEKEKKDKEKREKKEKEKKEKEEKGIPVEEEEEEEEEEKKASKISEGALYLMMKMESILGEVAGKTAHIAKDGVKWASSFYHMMIEREV